MGVSDRYFSPNDLPSFPSQTSLLIQIDIVIVPEAERKKMAESAIEPAEKSADIVAPVEDLLQTTPHQNCQRLVVLGSARSGKSSLVAR